LRDYLFNTEKIKYVKGAKPEVACILCAIRDGDPQVKSLEVTRTDGFIVSVNLYPFNPGHLIIFPEKHIISPDEYTAADAAVLHQLSVRMKKILDAEFSPDGYNIGYNIGRAGGASIEHLHMHIVPRYENEIGFIDVISGTRVVVTDPSEVMTRLKLASQNVSV
jgi:ATP adenylyltransferase